MSRGLVRLEATCDGCRRSESIIAASPEEAGAKLDAAGWLRNGARDQDLCPDCAIERVGSRVPGLLL